MPIREESFRIGCGRYLQGAGYLEKAGDEVQKLGKSPLIVGGKTALEITKESLENSIKEKCNKYKFVTHTGTCNEEDAKEIAENATTEGLDVIVGVGGGVICDFAKLCGYYAKLPVINIPTSSATCAAYTPLSVRYTKDGKTVGSLHYEYEVNCVIVDTKIMVNQPMRLFIAGVFDAIAKSVEIKQRFNENTTDYPIGLDCAYVLAKHSYRVLTERIEKCLSDMEKGEVTDDVEKVIFSAIAETGVISGIARGSNQTALGHKFYETTRFLFPDSARPYLHGEIVGIGLLLQNKFNNEPENNNFILNLMNKYNMPSKVSEIGVDLSEESFDKYYKKICGSSAVNEKDEEECKRFKDALRYLWERG